MRRTPTFGDSRAGKSTAMAVQLRAAAAQLCDRRLIALFGLPSLPFDELNDREQDDTTT